MTRTPKFGRNAGDIPETDVQKPKRIRRMGKMPSMMPTEAEVSAILAAENFIKNGDAIANAQAEEAAREEAANLTAEAAEMAIEAAKPKKVANYTGPMLILRQRLKAGAYGKMANGQPACGDQLAQMLGALKPEQVIRACMIAMAFDTNPYAHLNVGQQSMNLRNKLRGMLKKGDFGYGVVSEAIEEVSEEITEPDARPSQGGLEEQ